MKKKSLLYRQGFIILSAIILILVAVLVPMKASAAEAKIGDTEYNTLSEAIAQATEGQTVTLLSDVTTNSCIEIKKDITLDLGGHTITGVDLVGNTGGAQNINCCVFQVYNKVTIKNGTVTNGIINDSVPSSNLVNVMGGELTVEPTTAIKNSGTGAAVFLVYNTSTLIANGGTFTGNVVGITGCTAIINGGTFNGTLGSTSSNTNGSITINGGAFKADPSAYVTSGVNQLNNTATDGYYYVGEAKVGTAGYSTLEQAYASLTGDGSTIELLCDVTTEKPIDVNKTVIFKSFAGNKFKITAADSFSGDRMFITQYGHDGGMKTLNIQDLELVGKSGVRHVYVYWGRYANFTNVKFTNGDANGGKGGSLYISGRVNIKNCQFENNTASSSGAAVYVTLERSDISPVVNIDGCTVDCSAAANAICIDNAAATVNLRDNTSVTASTSTVINNGTLNVTNSNITSTQSAITNNGTVTVNSGNVIGTRFGIVNTDKVYIKGGTVEGTGNEGISNGSQADRIAKVEISGGTVKGAYAICDYSQYDAENHPEYLNIITGGTVENTSTAISTIGVYAGNGGTWSITGGLFKHASGSSAGILDTKIKWQESETLAWTKDTTNTDYYTPVTAVAKIGDVNYPSLNAAFAAVSQDGTQTTITLLCDTTMTERVNISTGTVNVTLDLQGYTLTGPSGNDAILFLSNNTASVTVENGKLVSNGLMVIASQYGNVTLEDVTVDYTGKGNYAILTQGLSSTLTLKGNTVINSSSVAIYAYSNGTANIENATVNGGLTADGGNINITKGTFSVDPTAIDGITFDAEAKITNNEGTVVYDTLVNALIGVKNDETIDILNNIDVASEYVMYDKTFTINGGGHTLKRVYGNSDNLLAVTSGKVTVKNIIVDGGAIWSGDNPATRVNSGLTAVCNNRYNGQLVFVGGSGEFVLGEGAILQNNLRTGSADGVSDGGSAVVTNGNGIFTMQNGSIIRDCTVYNTASLDGSLGGDGAAISLWESSSANINGGLITGNFAPRMGGTIRVASAAATLNISGGTITGNYTKTKSFGNLALTGHNINISGSPEIYDNYAVPHYADDGYHTAEKVQSHIVIYNDGSINADGLDVQKPIMISFTTAQASTDELTGELAVNRVAGTIMQGGAQYADMFTTAIDGYIVYVDGNDLVTKQLTDSDNIVYVDKNAAVGGDGTRNHPFNVLNQDVFADARLTANGGYIVLLSDVDKSTYISNGTGIHTNNQQLVIISEGNKKTITDQTNTLNYTYWHLNAGYAFNLVLDHVILDGTGGNTTDYGGFFIGDGGTLTLNHGTVLQNYVNRAVNVRPGGQLNIYEGCQIINNKANLNAPYNTLDGVDGVENVGGAVYVCAGGRLQLCNESTDKNYIGKQILIEGNKDADGNSTGIYLESGSYMNTAAANALVKDQIYVNPTSDTYIGEVNTTLLFHRYQQFDDVYLADGASIGKNGTQEKPIGITMQNAAVGAEAVHIYSGGTQDLDMFKTDGSYLLAAVDSAYVVVQPEAKIGNTLYYTLADAVANAQNGQTVDMLTDITATAQIKIPEGKDITVNLGGYTVRRDSAGVNMFSVDAGGSLTLENGTLDGNNVSLAPSGTNTTTNQNLVQVNGSFKATDVTFTNAVTRWGAIITYANSELELTGCEISGNRTNDEPNSCGAAIHAYGTVKLTDCTITNNTELNSAESCSAVHLKNSASVELCGTNYIYDNMRGENQANIILAANNQITVSSSIADSKIGVTAGSFTPVAKGTESYTVATADALCFVDDSGAMLAAKSGNTVLFSQAVAEINGVKYASLADAVAMANSGDTVILLGDVTLSSKLVIEKDITITSADGENYKIIRAESFANDDLISVGSDANVTLLNVTVDGNGVEITKDGVNLINVNGGSLTIEDGALITGHNDITETGNTKGTVFAAGGATVTMNGGEISGNKALYGSAVTAYNTSDGNVNTFTMNGGIITENISTGRENGTVAGAVQVGQNGSTFNMNGGEIIDNTAVNAYGAGVTVLNGGVMNVKGDATVFDNTAADKQNNVYLIDGATLNVTGALENNIGVTAANGAPNVTASGYKLTEDDAFKLIEDTGAFAPEFSDGNVSFETAVAENVNSGLRYTTLATAANKANADDTINILCDITLTSGQVSIDKNLTIDLGGHTLKRGNNNGALLAVPQGAVANLTVKNGTLDGDKETYSTSNVSRYALVNTESNSVVVFTAEKVTFKNNYGRYGGALFMTSGEGNSAHLNDCVVSGNRAYQCGGAFHLYAPVYLNNCIITDNYDDMTGDNIGANGYALHMKDNTAVYLSGKIVITGNTSGNNNTPANLPVYATTPIYIEGALNDGSAIGVKVINGNIIASGTESYTVTNADAIKFIDDTGEKAAVKSENTVVWAEPAVSVNGVNYAKLSDAIAAIPDGEETSIVLKADINETLTIPANKNVVLDLAGFTVDASSTNGSGITNNGTLTVKDSSEAQTGTVIGRYGISNNGEFTLLSGTLVGTGNDGIFNSPDATSLTIAGGTIKGNNLAICDYATNGTVELLGGVLECTGTGSSAGTGYVIGSYGSNVGGSWTIATDGSVVMKNANHTTQLINGVDSSDTAGDAQIKVDNLYTLKFTEGEDGYYTLTTASAVVAGEADGVKTEIGSSTVLTDGAKATLSAKADEIVEKYNELINKASSTEQVDEYMAAAKAELDALLWFLAPENVYVSAEGNNDNFGTVDSPVATLDYALKLVNKGGNIYVMTDLTITNYNLVDKDVNILAYFADGDANGRRHTLTADISAEDGRLNPNASLNTSSQTTAVVQNHFVIGAVIGKDSNNRTVAVASDSVNVNIENFILTGGWGYNNYTSSFGGSIYVFKGSTLTVNNCEFKDNQVGYEYYSGYSYSGYGGAVYNDGTLYMTDCVVTENTANQSHNSGAGGIHSGNDSTAYITRVAVTNNTANTATSSTAGPGGVYCGPSSTVHFKDVTVTDNTTIGKDQSVKGGGVLLYYSSTLYLDGKIIINNNNFDQAYRGGDLLFWLDSSGRYNPVILQNKLTDGSDISVNMIQSNNYYGKDAIIANAADGVTLTRDIAEMFYSDTHIGVLTNNDTTVQFTNRNNVTYDEVYVSESTGSDTNLGYRSDIAVKTFATAVKRVNAGGTIYVMDDLTVTANVNVNKDCTIVKWSNAEGTPSIIRADSFTSNNMITVAANVKFRSLTLDGNNIAAGNSSLIYIITADKTLELEGCTVQNARRTASFGGAIYQGEGNINITDCTFKNNSSTSDGGAIALMNANAVLNINNSRFENNSSGRYGGAIYAYLGTLDVQNTDFVGNNATSNGGAINQSNTVTTTFNECTFDKNTSNGYGGAIYFAAGTLTATKTDFTENTGKYAGAFYQASAVTSTFTDCDFTGNKSTDNSVAASSAALEIGNGTTYINGGSITGSSGSNTVYAASNAKLYLGDNVEIFDNTVTNSSGGAILLDGMLYLKDAAIIADNYYVSGQTETPADLTAKSVNRIQLIGSIADADILVNFTGTASNGAILASGDSTYTVTEDDVKAFSLTKPTDRVLQLSNNRIIFATPTGNVTGIEPLFSYSEGNSVTAAFKFTTDSAVASYNAKIGNKTGTVIGTYQGNNYVVKFTGLTAGESYTVQGTVNNGVASGETLSWTAPAATKNNGNISNYWSEADSGTVGSNGLVKDGIAYSVKTENRIDVQGYGKTKTTYANAGWTVAKNDNGVTVWAVPTIVKGASGADYVQLTYYIRNNTNRNKTGVKVGAHADIMIGSNDRAPIYLEDYGIRTAVGDWDDALSFAIITQHGDGIAQYASDASSRWFGHYGSRSANVFTNVNKQSLTNTDSGAAFSWQNLELAAGEIKAVSVVIGVAGNENVENDVISPEGGFNQGIDKTEGETVTLPKSETLSSGAVTESVDSITVDVEAGKTYYIKDNNGNIIGAFEAEENGTHTFTGLQAGTEYTITVKEDGKDESDGITVTTSSAPTQAELVTGSFNLGDYQKSGLTYSFPNADATISSGSFSNLSIKVDTGSFKFNTLPAVSGSISALTKDGRYVTQLTAGEEYTYIIVNQAFTEAQAESLLRSVTFVKTDVKTTQNIFVDSDVAALSNGVLRMGSSYYRYISQAGISWENAYKAAKQSYQNGLQGYLMTVEDSVEHQFIYQAFGNVNGWMGGLRTNNDDFDADIFAATKGSDWVWVCGPNSGEKINSIYTNWNSGEPNNYGNSEWAAQYGYGASGKWNDLSATSSGIGGYFVEYTEYGENKAYNSLAHGEASIDELIDTVEELQTAIDNAAEGDVIELDGDIIGKIEIPADKNITLDLNGHKLAGNKGAIINNGSLNVIDSSESKSGQIVGIGTDGSAIVNKTDATLNIIGINGIYGGAASADDVTNLTGDNSSGIYMYGGTVTVTDSTVKGYNYGVSVNNGGSLAVNEAENGETVISGTADGAIGIYVSANSTADINGGDINGTIIGIRNDGTTTVSGENTTVYGHNNGICNGSTENSAAQLTVEGGNITSVNYGIATWGTADIEGGSVSANIGIGASGDAVLTVSGGVISGTGETGIKNAATTVLNGGNIVGTGSADKGGDGVVNTGTLTVNDGAQINAERNGIWQTGETDANVTVNGGDIQGTNCGIYDDSTNGTGTIYGGSFTSSNGSNGYVLHDTNNASDLTITPKNDIILTDTTGGGNYIKGDFEGNYLEKPNDDNSIKLIEPTLVGTLEELKAAIAAGKTDIRLTADIVATETIVIPQDKTVNLYLGDFSITETAESNTELIKNYGNLTVNGGTLINSTAENAISNHGDLTLNDVTVSGGYHGISNFKTDGQSNTPTVTVNGGSIIGDKSGIYNENGETVINGNAVITGTSNNGVNNTVGSTLTVSGNAEISGASNGILNAGTTDITGDATIKGTGEKSNGITNKETGTLTVDGNARVETVDGNAVKNSGTATLNDGIYIGTGTYASVYEDSTNDAVSTVIGGGTYNQTAIADTVTGGEFKNLTVSDSVSDAAVNGKLTWTSEEPNVSNVTFGENATLGNKGYEIDGNTVKRAPITVNSLEELNAAISNAKPDDIIKLGTDIEGSITISEGLNIILDLNGHTLTGNGTNAAVTNNGTLIVRDSSADSTGTLTGATGIVNNGNATIEGGNVLGTTGHAVENKSTGTLLVTGDAYISGEVRGIYNNGGNLTVTGDDVEIYGNTGSAVTTFNGGTATLNGGTYDAVAYAAISTGDNSQTTINGGSYDGAYVTTITGGSFTGNVSVSDSIKDATVNGTLIWTSEEPNVTNVTFGENAKLDNKYYKIDGNTVVKLETITVNSLDELNDAIKAGIPNIKLGADIEGQITIPEGSNVTLDLNGHSITTADKHTIQVENNAKLTVMDSSPDKSGKIEATSTEGVHHAIQNRGDVVVEGGTIIGAKSGINLTSEGNGTVVINGGTVQGTSGSGVINDSSYDGVALTVNGGSIIGNTSGIYNWDADVKTVINGGEITATAGSGVDNNGGELTVTGGNIIGAMQGINTNGVVNITGDASISGTENNGIYNYGGGVLTVTGNASIEGKQNAVCNNATATLNGGTYTGHGTYASVYEDSTNDAVSTVIGGGTYNQTAIADTVTGGEFKNLTVSDSVSSATVNGKLTWTSEEPNVSDVTFGENATLGNEGYEIDGNTVKRVSITVNSLEELNAAISNAKPDDVIKLGADIYITDSLNILEGKNITIEGNGHSIIRDENYKGNVFNVEGSLTLNSVIVDGNNVNANTPLILVNGGTVTLNDGSTLKNAQNTETDGGNNAGGAVNITNGGSFIMNDGSSIENCEYRYGGAVLVGNTNGTQGTFVMNGGEISGCNASSTGNGYGGGAVYVWHGTADLNGGEISGNTANNGVGNDIYVYGSDASVELSGGIKVDDLYKDTNSNLYITGELSGAIGVTTDAAAGTIVAQPKDNYTITDADADKLIVENRDLEIKDGNVVITDALIVNSLEELNAAIGNARPGDIIKLGTDIEGSITIPEDVDITIDLNGHIITGTNNVPVITNNGTLTLVDTSGEQSGQIIGIGNNGTGILNGSDATLRVDGGKISATGEATAAVENNGSATISGGTLTAEKGINNLGDLTVSGGTITGNKFDGITNGNTEVKNATVNMSGGTVEGVKYAICDYASDSVNTITGGTLVNLEGEEGGIQGNGYVLSAHRDNIGGTWVIATDGSVQFRNDEGTTNFVNGVAADGTPSSSQIKVENFDTLKFTDTDGDGVYTVIKDVSTDILRYINLSLNGAIGVNLYFDLPQSYFDGGYDLIYQVAGGEAQQISVSNELEQDTDGTWIFPLSVNAKQMTDSISFWFENSGEVVSETRTTTVAEYAYYILGSGIETLNCGANDSTQLKALMAAMLNYGAEAQNYFSYNTENLANSNLGNYTNDNGDAYADYFTALDSTMFDDTNAWNVADGEFFAGSDETREGITDIDVELGDTTTMNIYFRVAKGTDLSNYRFNVTHTELYGNGNYYNLNEYAYAAIEQSDEQFDYYYVSIQNIPAAYLDHTFRLEITKEGNKIATLETMVTYYIKQQAVDNPTDEALTQIATSLYWYNYYANLYFRY